MWCCWISPAHNRLRLRCAVRISAALLNGSRATRTQGKEYQVAIAFRKRKFDVHCWRMALAI